MYNVRCQELGVGRTLTTCLSRRQLPVTLHGTMRSPNRTCMAWRPTWSQQLCRSVSNPLTCLRLQPPCRWKEVRSTLYQGQGLNHSAPFNFSILIPRVHGSLRLVNRPSITNMSDQGVSIAAQDRMRLSALSALLRRGMEVHQWCAGRRWQVPSVRGCVYPSNLERTRSWQPQRPQFWSTSAAEV